MMGGGCRYIIPILLPLDFACACIRNACDFIGRPNHSNMEEGVLCPSPQSATAYGSHCHCFWLMLEFFVFTKMNGEGSNDGEMRRTHSLEP